MGNNAIASGESSLATGHFTTAAGDFSSAMGFGAKASGDWSFAIHLNWEEAPIVGDNTFRISGATSIGGNLAWTNLSDIRLKKDIQPLSSENNINKITHLNGVRFKWKDNDSLLNLGFIAQEVLDIIPETVRYDEDNDIYMMEYTAFIPVLVEAIKEQQKEIVSLKAEIEMLNQNNLELQSLKAEIEAIKAFISK
jgi:hypothetical protein